MTYRDTLKETFKGMGVFPIEEWYINMQNTLKRYEDTPKKSKEFVQFIEEYKQDIAFVQGYLHARLEALKS